MEKQRQKKVRPLKTALTKDVSGTIHFVNLMIGKG